MKPLTRLAVTACSALAFCGVALLGVAAPAGSAQFPGVNGQIQYSLTDYNTSTIHLISPDGTGDVAVVSGIGASFDASGTRMSYVTMFTGSGGNSLHVINTDGTGDVTVATRTGGDNIGMSSLSPDASRVTYQDNVGGTPNIWVSNIDGTNAVNLTNSQFGYIMSPQFSPDGNSIVFSGANGPMSHQVFEIDLTTQVITQLTSENFGIGYVSWKPDGSGFMAVTDAGIAPSVVSISRDGSSVSVVFDYGSIGVGAFFSVMMSPDGTQLVFMTSNNVPGSLNDPQVGLGASIWTSFADGVGASVLVPAGASDPVFPTWASVGPVPTTTTTTTTTAPTPVTPKITG